MLKLLVPLFILCGLLLAGCGSSAPSIKPFKMDIQQGNVVTSKMLLQLKPGMTKSQVRFIMGTPLIVDSFHKDRWDYFYQMRQAGKIVEQRRVILDFEKDLLSKVRGDVVPQGTSGAAVDEAAVTSAPITLEPKPKETSMLDKLKFWKKDEKVITKPEVKPELMTPAAPVAVPVEAAAAALPAVAEVAEVAEVASSTAEKSMPEKSATVESATEKSAAVKSASEKSWLDKLKFWKKDESAAAAEKIASEAPNVDSAAALPDVPAADTPSVLAVPIDLPSTDAPPPADIAKEEPVVVEPLKTEPVKLEPPVSTKKPAVPNPVVNNPVVNNSVAKKSPVESPATKAVKPLPSSSKNGEPQIFRMDKTLDLARGMAVKPEAMPAPVAPVPSAIAKPIKAEAEAEPLPVETEPNFFDKMLEKIGF